MKSVRAVKLQIWMSLEEPEPQDFLMNDCEVVFNNL